jgi:VanZ family protein
MALHPRSARPVPSLALSESEWRALRWLPFAAAALFSLAMSALAPEGRRPFDIDWSLSAATLELSVIKAPHIGACALLALLGVLGAGARGWPLALLLTVLVGAGWELCQTTVIGHSARLADLAPDSLGALIGCGLGVASLWLIAAPPGDAEHR